MRSKNIMSFLTVILTLCVALNCSSFNRILSGKDANANTNSVPSANTDSDSNSNTIETADAAEPQVKVERDLFSFAEGSMLVKPDDVNDHLLVTAPLLMIDGSDVHNWVGDVGVKSQSFVIEMPDKATLKTLVFDNDTSGMGGIDAGVKDFSIEVSDTSSTAGFQEILAGSLKKGENGQKFTVATAVAGRWVRANFKNNQGGDRLSLTEIRGFGDVQAITLASNVSGTYEVLNGAFHIKQDGTMLSGCYEPNSSYSNPATFTGGIEGNVARVNYKETKQEGGAGEESNFLMVFARDGKRFFTGMVSSGGGISDYREVKRTSDAVGTCKNYTAKAGAKDQIGDELKKEGRAILYGINFDFNSDVIRPESKNVLDQVAAMLRDNADMKITIEGHTDNVGGEKFNQALSDKRANAVKNSLVTAGIAAVRLQAVGKGMSSPVASNDGDIGRAQNRRVELVRH